MGAWTVCCLTLGSAAGALFTVLCWLWMTRPRTNAPGPTPLPLLGNALLVWKLPILLGHFRDWHRRYGDVFRLYFGPKLFVVVTQPEDVRMVLIENGAIMRDPFLTRPLRRILGNGLLTSNGDVWKAHRRIIEPAFRSQVLVSYSESFNEGALFVCERIAAVAGSKLDVYNTLFQSTIRTIAVSMFSINLDDVEADAEKQADFSTKLLHCISYMRKLILRPWLHIDWIMLMTSEGKSFQREVNWFYSLVKHGYELNNTRGNKFAQSKTKNLRDILNECKDDEALSEDDMYNEVYTFLLAGSETTATQMCFALALLGLHPKWQDEAQQELDLVFGTGEDFLRPSTVADLSQLVVLDSILKETMRLYPVAPNEATIASKDIPLAGGRFVAPQGCCVIVPFHLLHRQAHLFPDAEQFDPGRFLEGGSAAPPKPHSYMPFSVGARRCVGERYAMIVMKTVLAAVLRRFRVLPGSSRQQLDEIEANIVGHPTSGFMITCIPRENLSFTSE